jgi:hypothetical protein
MWTERVYLGPTPAEETAARVGHENYEQQAQVECRAYIEAIRKVLGVEPEGARLVVSRQEREFGDYYEVVCEYDAETPDAAQYAARCEEDAPATWAIAGMTVPVRPTVATQQSGKRYIGTRTPDECVVVVVASDGSEEPLDPRFDLRRHSPDGFNWGYGGSGPAQLALALLADALGDDEKAEEFYQGFKFKVLARVQGDSFELSQEDVFQALARLKAERGNRR